MPVTKSSQAITQLITGGPSITLTCPTSNNQVLLISSSNGTGTITTPASVAVQVKTSGAARWYTLVTFPGGTTAATTDQWACKIPDAVASVQLVYTAPSGPSGFTLDAELATETLS